MTLFDRIVAAWAILTEVDFEPKAITALDLTHPAEPVPEVELEEVALSQPDGFAVTGAPRQIPWSRRKKELEAASRKKRRQLEEFREEA